MSGIWQVNSPKLNGGLCRVYLLFDTSGDNVVHLLNFHFRNWKKATSSSKIINHALQKAEDFPYNYEHPQYKIGNGINKIN